MRSLQLTLAPAITPALPGECRNLGHAVTCPQPITHAADKTLEHRHAGQQHFMGEEPFDRLLEQQHCRFGKTWFHSPKRLFNAASIVMRTLFPESPRFHLF